MKPIFLLQSLASFCSGLTAGLFGINLLFLAYMERTTADRETFRVNACFVFFLENIFRIILYLTSNLYGKETLLLSAIALPAALLGMKTGALIGRRINDHVSRRLINVVFILSGVSTVIYTLPKVL